MRPSQRSGWEKNPKPIRHARFGTARFRTVFDELDTDGSGAIEFEDRSGFMQTWVDIGFRVWVKKGLGFMVLTYRVPGRERERERESERIEGVWRKTSA